MAMTHGDEKGVLESVL
ncbi:BnaC04g31580D [Brassica napus]|uniref:BnaC04g31580D protein n=1 Tax=Brassica napus TaxID=3708 RepID=A0A078GYC4_BRANA|nr:BnaC04g31580D [Brassica napus]